MVQLMSESSGTGETDGGGRGRGGGGGADVDVEGQGSRGPGVGGQGENIQNKGMKEDHYKFKYILSFTRNKTNLPTRWVKRSTRNCRCRFKF